MDWKSFIVDMARATAWPVTTLFIVFLLKDFISQLAPRISKLRHKDTEIEFAEAMGALRERAESVALSGSELEEELRKEKKRLNSLSAIIPRSALLQAWGLIDREVADYLLEVGAETEETSLKTRDVVNQLKELGLNKRTFNTFLELRQIMKSVAGPKNFELSSEQLESYIELAVDVAHSMRSARSDKAFQRESR